MGRGIPGRSDEEPEVRPVTIPLAVPDRVRLVVLSRRSRETGSSREDVDAEPGSPLVGRGSGTETLRGLMRGLMLGLPVVEVVREGRMKRSATVIELGGDLLIGREVRAGGRLLKGEEPEMESRC